MPPPNVLLFFTDQQRWDCSSLHGNPLDLMPNFERMARGGTHLAHSFTCQPVCGPARAALQTGQYGTANGCFTNGRALPESSRTMAHTFREAGYHTGYIGKWHLADDDLAGPVRPAQRGGYDEWLASNALEFTSDAYRLVMYDGQGQPVRLPGYRVDAQTDAVIRFVDRHQDKPFFLMTSYIEPHQQNSRDDYPAPDGYAERYRGRWMPPDLAALPGSAHQHIAGYYGMVRRLDEALGRVLDALKSLGLDKNTVVLFTSDHGCHFETRNGEYKRSCHDSSIRVPTAITGPGFRGGGTVHEMVSLVDLPPTLLDAAGLRVPPQMQGRSILPLLRGRGAHGGKSEVGSRKSEPARAQGTGREEGGDWPGEVFVQISETEVGRAVRTHRWKYAVRALEADPWNQPGAASYTEQFLYNLESDPYELENLIGLESHREVCDVMKARLLRRMQEAGEGPAVIHHAPGRPAGQRRVLPEEVGL